MLAQIVLILALLLILVGMIMVLLDAFSESFIWGLLVLLLVPIFGPVYSFVKWHKDQARYGFAMSLVGVVMVAAGVYGGGVHSIPILGNQEIVKNLPSALPPTEPLPNEAAAAKVEIENEGEYDPILSTNKDRYSTKEIEPLAPKEDKTVKSAGRSKVRKIPLSIEDINLSIGSNVEVVFVDGATKRGQLIASAENSISLEEQTSGGSVSFEHKFEKIKSIVLLVDPSAAPPPPVVKKQDPALGPDQSVETTISKELVTPQNKTNVPTPLLEQQAPQKLNSDTNSY